MTAVSQKIPNFIGGISQQPDELIVNGSVKDALNVIPDVRGVVSKRPGSELVKTLTNDPEGVWYDYYRDENEQYVIRVRRNGIVDVWNSIGVPLIVKYNPDPFDPTDGIQNSDPGLPTPPSPPPSDDDKTQFPLCQPATLVSTQNAVTEAANNLTNAKAAIEQKNVELSQLKNFEKGTLYFKKNGNYAPKVGGSDVYGDKKGPSKRPTYPPRGKPDLPGFNVDLVYVEKGPISFKREFSDRGTITTTLEGYYYGWFAKKKNIDSDIANVKNQIKNLEATIPGLLAAYNNALAIYENEAVKCGIYENPFSRTVYAEGDPEPSPYLIHEKDSDLQFVTINDYTFINNRLQIPTMSSINNVYDNNYESYISLNVLQSNKPYTVFIDLLSTDTGNKYTRATQLTVDPASWEEGDGSCPFTGTQVFTETKDGRGPLQFRLTTIGSQFYDQGSKPEKPDYDCRYQTTVELLSSGTGWGVGDFVKVNLEGKTYKITVTKTVTATTSSEIIVDSTPIGTTDPLDSTTVLGDLQTKILAQTSGLTVDIIGNGLLVRSPNKDVPFKITTPDAQYLTCVNGTVNNISELPQQCSDGFLVKVINSFIDEDDYWVVFKGEENEQDGAGYWEETHDPTIPVALDYNSMPIQLIRLANETFELRPIQWGQREVGDELTNPTPSFIGNPINKLLFFRNRFTVLAGETIVMSRPNEYFNFWVFTAKVVSPADPIDVRTSSTFPSILYDGIDTAAGLLVFSENQQHLVVTDNTDILSPETVSVKSIGTYQYSIETRPVDMGQTVGFLNNAGYRSRFFELVPSRDFNYQASEVSKPVDQLVPDGINLVSSSKDNNMIAFAVRGTSDVWIYRFFQTDQERKQSAWFRWKIDGKILHHYVHRNSYYVVTEKATGDELNPTIVTLQRFNLNIDRGEALINVTDSMRDYDYQVHLDSYFMVTPSEMQYDADANTTSFRLPIGYHGDSEPVVYQINLDQHSEDKYVSQGRTSGFESLLGVPNGVIGTLPGNWTDSNLVTGFPFEMKIQMPTFYPSKSNALGTTTTKDTRSYLTLHRVRFDFETIGFVSVTVERKGREDFTIDYEATTEDAYLSDSVAIELTTSRVVPIYDKNVNADIYLTSTHPSPMSLISASWEGDYNTRNYKNA